MKDGRVTACDQGDELSGGAAGFAPRRLPVAIYVDRETRQWVVRDSDGAFWILPPKDSPWEERLPYFLSEETDLERIPGHYRYMLRLPF